MRPPAVVGLIALTAVALVSAAPTPSWAGAKTCLTGTDPAVAADLSQINAARAVIESQELSPPIANPAAIAAGLPTLVVFTIALTPDIRGPKLQFWDPTKGKWQLVGTLRDNGKFGDANKGDHVFSLQTQLLAAGGNTQLGLTGTRKLRIKGVVPTPVQLRLVGRKKGQQGLVTSPEIQTSVLNVSVPQAVAAAGGMTGDTVATSPEPG